MPKVINAQRLERFLILSRVGHVGRAAATIGIGQALLTREMKSLEAELGVQLFGTHPHGISLTASGLSLARLGDGLLRFLSASDKPEGPTAAASEPCLGITSALSRLLVPEVFHALKGLGGARKVAIKDASSADLEAGVLDGSIDAALLCDPPPRDECTAFPIATEDLLFVYPPMWALNLPNGPLKMRQLNSLTLVGVRMDVPTRNLLDRYAQKQGLRLRYEIEVEHPATMISLVLAGLGCAICHRRTVDDEVARGRLLVRPIGPPAIASSLKLVCRKEAGESERVLGLLALVRAALEAR